MASRWLPGGRWASAHGASIPRPVTPVSVYRQHSSNDNNPFMREDCYRHAVWISGVDAKQRGIKDGDLCRVYSDRGGMRGASVALGVRQALGEGKE